MSLDDTKTRSVLAAKNQTIRIQGYVIGAAFLMNGLIFWGWKTAPENINLHYPPNLMMSSTMRIGQVSNAELLGFATLFYQRIYNWQQNGEHEFTDNIHAWRGEITPEFQAVLFKEIDQRNREGELSGRVRTMKLLPVTLSPDELVQPLDADHWRVWLYFQVQEFVNGKLVKDLTQKIPLRVARYAVDMDANPWQLALDGYDGPIIELVDDAMRKKYGVDPNAKQ